MSASRSVKISCVVITLACMFFGACGGVCWMALRITGKPQVFRSLAKLVAGGPTVKEDLKREAHLQDFYGSIIETIQSAEMSRRASERLRALHPDLRDSAVEIRVAQTKGSAIFNILATGSEPRRTQIFLNALLDEFIAFRNTLPKEARKDDVAVMERATTAAEHVDDWKMPVILGGAGGAALGLGAGLLVSLFISVLGRTKAPQA